MKIKHELFEQIPECFKCPATGLNPTNEEQLSGLIGLYWKLNLINWNKVNLYSTENKITEGDSKLFFENGIVSCEYPLFAEDKEQIKNHGGMKADIIYLTKQHIVLIENKIGSRFTYGGTQLDRQAKYLNESLIKNKFLILLSSKTFFNKGWYIKELEAAVRQYQIKGYLMYLEEIFDGITSQCT
ncbi:MAG: hypothetical protein SRB2_00594 [Desulfobacteraceae bacterium Eth-SRB2]|nr:MAG: hypothetical protein SRB2_00594 [Desulfobacteraceae bacterium Eth-SRB2]